MRKWSLLPMAVALMLPVAALADAASDLKKEVEANHVKAMKAFAKKDVKGMMAFVADDYSGVDMMGQKQNKAAVEKEMAGYIKDTKKVNSSSYTVSGVKVNGNKASGKAKFVLDALVVDTQGMMGAKGKAHRMKMDQDYAVTWVKRGGKWLLTSENPSGPPKMEVDGKPMSAGGPPPAP
jgi:ketosteroid isomerase-like protein